MAFNISDFRGQLVGGGARPNLFRVTLGAPAYAEFPAEKMAFMAKAAQLPESTIGSIEVPYFGRNIKIAGDRTFAEWTITVINDEDFLVRDSLERWMDGIDTHTRAGTKRGSGDVIKTVTFVNLFPTNVAAIDLAWDSNDAIEEFTVTLQYDHYTSNTTT